MWRVLVVACLVSVASAGCLEEGAPDGEGLPLPGTEDVWSVVRAAMAGVPCDAPVPATATSKNLKELAVLPRDTGRASLDPFGEFLVSGHGTGVDVISVAHPMKPRVVLELQIDRGYGDTKWLGDGRHIAAPRSSSIQIIDVGLIHTLGAHENLTVDAQDHVIGEWKFPGSPPAHFFANMHMLEAHRIGGVDYVFLAPNDDTGVHAFKVLISDAKATFETLPNIGGPLTGGPLGPHDMTVEDDRLLKKPILYIANGFEGWLAYDVSDPKNPTRLALMVNADPGQGYTHTIAGNQVGTRRLVATIAEVGVNMLKVYDATDFTRPLLLAEWWAEAASPQSPQHDIVLVGDHLYVAHYTKGVYVFDLSKLPAQPLVGTASMRPLAHFHPQTPMDGGQLGFANVFDVNVVRGVLYASDFTDKAHAVTSLGFGCLAPGDPSVFGG